MAELVNNYELINLQFHQYEQGSVEWLKHREKCFNASEIAMVLGCSPYMTRSALLKAKATGLWPEISSYQQKIFDKGHKDEKLARPFAEKILGKDLFTPTISAEVNSMLLSASYDGLCIMDKDAFEHKTLNKDNGGEVEKGMPHLMYRAQMEQQLLLSGADKVLFMVSVDGNEETMRHCFYKTDPVLRDSIISAWAQFREDLQNYVYVPEKVAAVATEITALPTLNIQIQGGVTGSNLEIYRKSAHEFIEKINTELKTDQHFADAEKTVKFLKEAEIKIKLVKEQAISQTVDIEAMFNTLKQMSSEFAAKRLMLDKLVKAEKANIKQEIINKNIGLLFEAVATLNDKLAGDYIVHNVDFHEAIKSKRTITSIESAASDALANAKIEINKTFETVEANLAMYKKQLAYPFLFMDINTLILKDREVFSMTVKGRISDHQISEQKRLDEEREKIKKELEEKAEREEQKKKDRIANEKTEQEQKDKDKEKREKKDQEIGSKLTQKITSMANNATSNKRCDKTQELPLEAPKVLTIEQAANDIAVKFCHSNGLNPDQISVLIGMISNGYRQLIKEA